MTETDNPVSAPEKKGRGSRMLLLAIVLCALVAAGFAVKPVGRTVKRWHARRLAAQAEAAVAQNDPARALERVKSALIFSRFEPSVLRAAAHVLAQATNSEALQYWQLLEQNGQITADDRQEAVVLAIRTGFLKTAVQQVNKLLDVAPQNATNLWLASQIFAANGERDSTLLYAGRAMQADPANRRYQLFLWSVSCGDANPATRAAARAALLQLARGPDEIAWLALEFLADQSELTPGQIEELISLAASHPHPGVESQLVRLELQCRARPAAREQLLEELVAQNKTAPPEKRCAIGVWLIRKGEAVWALRLLPLDEALHRKDFFLIHVDALAALRRWEELQKILSGYVPLEPVFVEAFLARCCAQRGEDDSAEVHWDLSFAAARSNPEQMPWLANYALMNGATAPAKRVLRELARSAADKRAVFNLLLGLVEQSGKTGELLGLMEEMQRIWPDDDAIRTDVLYLQLLLDEDAPGLRRECETLVEKSPDNLAARTALALAFYRQKDFPAALKLYEGLKHDWTLALPAQRVVYAAVLVANGRDTEAREVARTISSRQLRAEEKQLIKSLLGVATKS